MGSLQAYLSSAEEDCGEGREALGPCDEEEYTEVMEKYWRKHWRMRSVP